MSSILDVPLSLYSIPAAWVLAHVPHVIKFRLMTKANGHRPNNNTPRLNVQKLAAKENVDPKLKEKIARADAAHWNGLESYPFWSLAVLAANFAGLNQRFINKAALVYLVSRFAYNFVYVNQSKAWHGSLRSAVWSIGVAASFTLFISAANLVAARA